jgi:CheY-like chemotaxis protein
MPGKDGGEVANELRADASLTNAGIIFFTALTSEDEIRARPCGPRERLLSKAAAPATLLKTIKATMLSTAA